MVRGSLLPGGRKGLRMKVGRVLACDVGAKRIGVAVSDPLRISVRPLTTLTRDGAEIGSIGRLVEEHEVVLLVVGTPKRLDGSESETTIAVREFARQLQQAVPVPVVLVEERLSSKEAEKLMAESGIPVDRRRKRRDEFAAAVILTWYLEEAGGKR